MRKLISTFGITTCLACLALASPVLHAKIHSSIDAPVWKYVTKAYSSNDVVAISKYMHSDKRYVRLYAGALRGLSKWNMHFIVDEGNKCYRSKPKTSVEAVSYFLCLSAVSTAFFHNGLIKKGFLWRARLGSFYKAHADDIDRGVGSSNPAGIKDKSVSELHAVRAWPDQVVSNGGGWEKIRLDDGMAKAYIDGKPIMMQVDTGSTSIFLSQKDVKKLNLGNDLIPIGDASFFETTTRTRSGGNRYYVKDFVIGPVHIHDAYVIVYKGNTSIIGMSVLRSLKKFSISSHWIGQFHKSKSDACGPMMHSLSPVTGGSSFPFSYIKTNFGRMGLMLDNGIIGRGPFENADISLALNYVNSIKKYLDDANASVVNSKFYENGKSVTLKTVIFKVNVDGDNMIAYFGREDNYDERLSGSLTRNFLKNHVVSYDFPGRIMCIRKIN